MCYIFIIFFLFFSCFFSSVCFKQNLLSDTTTLSPLAASVNKYRHNIFHKKNTLHRKQNNRITVLRIKNKKEIDVSANLHHQVPRHNLQYYSNEEKHEAEDIVDPTELNKSESRTNNTSSPFRSTEGTLTDFNPNFENDPNPKVQKINQDCCENDEQEDKNREEKAKQDEKEKGHLTEEVSHSKHTDPAEASGEDRGWATGVAALNQCAEEGAQAHPETNAPGQPRNEAAQL